MKITNILLFAICGLVAWKVLGPSLQQLALPPGTTPTTQPNSPQAPAGQGSGDTFTQVVGVLEGLFGAIGRVAQANQKTH